jgi:hypothetical protein
MAVSNLHSTKEDIMKTRNTLFVTTALVATLAAAGAAFAHQGAGMGAGMGMGSCEGMGPGMGMMGMGPGMGVGMGPGMGPGMGMGGMQGNETVAAVTARLAAQKAALKISPAQEAAWGKYAALVTQQTEAHENMRTQMHAKMQDPKEAANIDHAALHTTMMKLQEENQAARRVAMSELQAVLTPDQQAQAGRGGQGPGGHRMGHQGMWH